MRRALPPCRLGRPSLGCALLAIAVLCALSVPAARAAPDSTLVVAVRSGDGAAVQAALDAGADLDGPDARGATPLLWAAYLGQPGTARLLLERGADRYPRGAIRPPGSTSTYYGNPLAAAIAQGHLDVLRLLVQDGGTDIDRAEWNPEEAAFTGWAPLHYAAALGQTEALAYLLDRGADLEVRDRFGFTPLARAVDAGMDAAVTRLLDAGADLSVTDDEGEPLLALAANEGHRRTAFLLLEAGADPNAAGPSGLTPLHLAALNGWTDLIDRLLDAGADLEARENAGATPLILALVKNEVGTLRRLLDLGADIDAADDQGYTVVHHAAMNGDPALLQLLHERGGDLSARMRYGDTPLHIALWAGRPDAAQFLIEAGSAVNARDHDLWTPLHYAVRDARLPVVAALRDAGAHMHWGKDDGWTPLHLAARNGHVTLTQALRCAGASPKARTKDGLTADSLARAQGHDRIRALLRTPFCDWSVEGTELRQQAFRHYQAGRYTEAVPLYERALEATELLLGPDHRDAIRLYKDLGIVHYNQNNHAQALRYLTEAHRRIQGRERAMPAVASPLYRTLAGLRARDGALAEAAELLAAATRYHAWAGESKVQRVALLLDLARARQGLGDEADAKTRLQEAAALLAEVEERSPQVASLYALLGNAYALRDQYAASDEAYERALALSDSLRATGALALPEAIRLTERAILHYAARHSVASDAAALATRVQTLLLEGAALRLDLLRQNLNQPQADLQHLLQERAFVDFLLSFAAGPDALPQAYAHLAAWKGLLLFALRQQSLAMQADDDAREYGDAIWQIEALREQLVALQQEAAAAAPEAWLAQQEALVARKSALERALLRDVAVEAVADPLPHPDTLRARLAPDEAFLDIYRFADYARDGTPDRYGAVLLTRTRAAASVDLGDAAALERRLADWRAEVQRGALAVAAWQALADTLWAPIAAALPDGVRKLWVSPDGALGRLPWGRLPSDTLLVAQIDAPRELAALLAAPEPTATRDRVLLVGDVDFGAATAAFAPLPGTAREVRALEGLARQAGVRPVVLTREAPDKTALQDRMGAYPYVHLATHGFFWASAAALAERRRGARSGTLAEDAAPSPPETAGTALRLPLLESGLAVANANAGANGLLTAEELIGLDLSGVEVLVLSACDTGRGAEVTGQGVLGLRAALAAAGARTLVMSLWPVPDASTALLMERFYEGLWREGLAPAEALRQAQDAVRADPRYAAPVHWAAWVLAGRGW